MPLSLRSRLRNILLGGLALAVAAVAPTAVLSAQEAPYRMAPNKKEVELDFLGNYYSQDGDFGAPQGGLGTEKLDNLAGMLYLNVPLDSNSAVSVIGGVDYYSSASTDQIDRQVSGASSSDVRGYGNLTYTQRSLGTGRSYRFTGGTSQEYDVSSFNAGLGISQEWNRGQDELSLNVQAYHDTWKLIYPIEFRRRNGAQWRGPLEDNVRQTYVLSLVYSRILTRRIQFALATDVVVMEGLLSTPFHRIYYQGNADQTLDANDIERLPHTRYKLPVSLRVNYKPNDVLVIRSLWRYYLDSWGVRAPSLDLELAYDVSEAWTLMPFGRYYYQQGARYYAEFAEHLPSEEYYTSDYDLATLSTVKAGIGLRYAPIFSLRRGQLGRINIDWRSVTARAAYYRRDAGLQAFTVTLGTKLVFARPRPLTAQ